MFKCQKCSIVSAARQKPSKVVTATRDKIYHKMVYNELKDELEEVEIGRGWEVVSEIQVCRNCHE